MSVQVLFPKIGFSMEEGVFTEWMVADGTEVKEGQPLYVIESDKSTQEVEAPASGVLKVIAEVGQTYKVGDVLAEIG
jgi:pyruvate/2-oxoglutarate dehydrogenase complex dihydrolipoamide acyltransferase (E2) component